MKIAHVLSTAAWRAVRGDSRYEMDTVEQLTMKLAVQSWKKQGYPVHLFTDEGGAAWAESTGLLSQYDKIIRLPALDHIDHKIFWSIYKAVALGIAGDAIVADIDLVTFKLPLRWRLASLFPVGHLEPAEWECYRQNRELFERYGFRRGWNWGATPVNTCLLGLGHHLRDEFVAWTLNFAENYTAHPLKPEECPNSWYQPALFGEQHLLGMLFDRFEVSPHEFFKLRHQHHEFNPNGFHLWGRKEVYRTCVEARARMVTWLLGQLGTTNVIDSEPSQEKRAIIAHGRVPVERTGADNQWSRTVLTKSGHCRAQDPCTGQWRALEAVDKVYRGDILQFDDVDTVAEFHFNGRQYLSLRAKEVGEVTGNDEAAIWQTIL